MKMDKTENTRQYRAIKTTSPNAFSPCRRAATIAKGEVQRVGYRDVMERKGGEKRWKP